VVELYVCTKVQCYTSTIVTATKCACRLMIYCKPAFRLLKSFWMFRNANGMVFRLNLKTDNMTIL